MSPENPQIALEIEVPSRGLTKRYGIVTWGRVIEILDEWETSMARYGIINTGDMSFYGTLSGPLGGEVYEWVIANLELCHITAQSMLQQRWSWRHIDTLFDFYSAIKWQSDYIINRFSEKHPELEDWSLPEISQEDRKKIHEALEKALANTLSALTMSEEWVR